MQVLALHGFTGCGSDFAGFSPLCRSVNTWHCPNLPGHGPDPQLDCSPEATVRFIQSQGSGSRAQASSLRPQVSGLRPPPSALRSQVSALRPPTSDLRPPPSALRPPPSILLGYSMGARAALLHAVRFPARWDALILISPNPGIEDEAKRAERRIVDAKLARRIEQDGAAAFIEFWQNTPMIRSQKNIRKDWRDAMQAHRKQHTAQGLAVSLRQFGQGQCPNLWPELPKLKMPVLLITGAEDLKYTQIATRMTDILPNSLHRQIKGAGHMPQLEAPEASGKAITLFLETLHSK